MKIAICFYGKVRTYKETFENIKKNLIDHKDHKVDIFISTWEEEKIDVSHELKKLYNPKKMIVEKYDKKKFLGFFNMYREYPMLYKIESAAQIALETDNYDLIFLARLDVVYDEKFKIENIKKNTFYFGKGVFDESINKVRKYWKRRIYKTEDFKEIWEIDPQSTTTWPKINYINPISDVLNYGSRENIRKFVSFMQILNIFKNRYDRTSQIRINIEMILRKIMKYLPKSIFVYKLYVIISKKFGFFIPLANGHEPVQIKHFKPSLFSYQIAFNNINYEISEMEYRFIRPHNFKKN